MKEKLNKSLYKIKKHEGIIRAITDITIMVAVLVFTVLGFSLYSIGIIEFIEMILALVIIASSFGPVVALSNLSNDKLMIIYIRI